MTQASPPQGTDASQARTRASVGAMVGAAIFAVVSLGVGGSLGTWQWQRAHDQAAAVEPEPRAPIAEVMRPAEPAQGEGRLVSVAGTWGDAPAAIVEGKEIDGVAAVVLLREFTVDADATGTGQEASLAVLSGWLPATDAPPIPAPGARDVLTGYVRGGEGSATASGAQAPDGAMWLGSMSTAQLAGLWPAPVYTYLVVADEPAPGWRAMPAPEPKRTLDFRSVTYAIEWWVFGFFGAGIAAAWIRDNMRRPHRAEES